MCIPMQMSFCPTASENLPQHFFKLFGIDGSKSMSHKLELMLCQGCSAHHCGTAQWREDQGLCRMDRWMWVDDEICITFVRFWCACCKVIGQTADPCAGLTANLRGAGRQRRWLLDLGGAEGGDKVMTMLVVVVVVVVRSRCYVSY